MFDIRYLLRARAVGGAPLLLCVRRSLCCLRVSSLRIQLQPTAAHARIRNARRSPLHFSPCQLFCITARRENAEQPPFRNVAARDRQRHRFANDSICTNARMTNRQIQEFCQLDSDSEALLERAMAQHAFSARSYTRILKLSRTIADLAASDPIRLEHISEAIQYRSTERHFWR